MPGKMLDVVVREGQHVAAGDALVVLAAMNAPRSSPRDQS